MMNNEEKLICKICGRECKKLAGLSIHIVRGHKIKLKDYYDKYLKKESSEGKCLECKKETKFSGLPNGYHKFCSTKCAQKSIEVREKYKKTCLINNGVDNPTKSKKIIKKREYTCLKKYGVNSYSKTFEFRELAGLNMIRFIMNNYKDGSRFSPNHGKNEKNVYNDLQVNLSYDLIEDQQIGHLWPDWLIKDLMLVIEYDEKWHLNTWARKRDKNKDKFYILNGYVPIHIKESDWFEDKELQIIKVHETIKFLKQVNNMNLISKEEYIK